MLLWSRLDETTEFPSESLSMSSRKCNYQSPSSRTTAASRRPGPARCSLELAAPRLLREVAEVRESAAPIWRRRRRIGQVVEDVGVRCVLPVDPRYCASNSRFREQLLNAEL